MWPFKEKKPEYYLDMELKSEIRSGNTIFASIRVSKTHADRAIRNIAKHMGNDIETALLIDTGFGTAAVLANRVLYIKLRCDY